MDGLIGLVGAIAGAILAGGFGIYDRISERRLRKRSITSLTKAHVSFLCDVIRAQDYHNELRFHAEEALKGDWDGNLYTIDSSQNYLDIFDCVKSNWGLIEINQATKIVEFYNRSMLFFDSTKRTGGFIEDSEIPERRSHAIEAYKNVERLLSLGDEIMQFGT